MRYSVAQAAKIVDKTRQTIYRHIETKPISVEKDDEGNIFIDASELLRVYGNGINFDAANAGEGGNVTPGKVTNVTTGDSETGTRVIEERLNSAQKQIEMLEAQIKREREIQEEQIERLSTALSKAQEGYNSVTKLLEDQRSNGAKGGGDWERSIKALESRLSNQEAAAKEKSELEAKILRENQMLKKISRKRKEELEAERSKPFWKKVFG